MTSNLQEFGGMGDIQVYFESTRKILICQIHGFVIPPTAQGISRHLRGKGHNCRGWQLRHALSTFASLGLSSMNEICSAQPSVAAQPVTPPILHLKILQGWSCSPCRGQYLTTSFELLERHLAAEHGIQRKDATAWESCDLQTFFCETKHRRYFRVSNGSFNHRDDEQNQLSCSKSLHPSRLQKLSDRACADGRPTTLAPSPRAYHPFACKAKEHVPWFPLSCLDRLFKSVAFELASEPLFVPGHVDEEFSMHTVFPLCHDDPVFYHALLYSMVQLSRHDKPKMQAAALQRATINLINSRLSFPQLDGYAPLIGAIMVLRGTAYKLGDSVTHKVHAFGLESILKHYGQVSLTLAARKAVFWQNLYAAIFLDGPCQIEPTDVFEQPKWLRCTPLGQAEPCQAAGFLHHQDILPTTLLDCVADILELQSAVSVLTVTPFHERYQYLDSMQASIESRLMSCRHPDLVIEAVRLGIFLCCYCSWVEIWDDKYIPCIIATKLFDKLETTVFTGDFDSNWGSHLDLYFWLLFIGSCVVGLGRSHVDDLRRRLKRLLSRAGCAMELYPAIMARYALHRALQDYLYCQDWLSKRSSIHEWYSFEIWIRNLAM